jgi:hypothetical protein
MSFSPEKSSKPYEKIQINASGNVHDNFELQMQRVKLLFTLILTAS